MIKRIIELVFLVVIYGLGVFAGTQLHKIDRAPFCAKVPLIPGGPAELTVRVSELAATRVNVIEPRELSALTLSTPMPFAESKKELEKSIVACPKQ